MDEGVRESRLPRTQSRIFLAASVAGAALGIRDSWTLSPELRLHHHMVLPLCVSTHTGTQETASLRSC